MLNKILPVVVALIMCFSLPGSAEIADYEIEQIPSLTIWHGDTLTFNTHWEGHSSASFDVMVTPQPKGEYSVEAALDDSDSWVFRYTPSEEDKRSFSVMLVGRDGSETASQAFDVHPMPRLPAEKTVFSTDEHTQPLYQQEIVQLLDSNPAESFNYLDRVTYDVTIIGEELIFDVDLEDEARLISYSQRKDLKSLELIADRLVIRSPLWFPGTNVKIWARELVFEQTGKITTTPEEKTSDQPQVDPADDPLDGAHGLDAGDIEIYIGSLEAPPSTYVLFELNGGEGQAGSEGYQGHFGDGVVANFGECWDLPCPSGAGDDFCTGTRTEFCTTDMGAQYAGYNMIFWKEEFWGMTYCDSTNYGGGPESFTPLLGTSAIAGGQPGYGGKAGVVTSNFDVSDYVSHQNGETPEPRHYDAGAPGYPPKWMKIGYTCTQSPGSVPTSIYLIAAGDIEADAPAGTLPTDAADPNPEDKDWGAPRIVSEGHAHSYLHPLLFSKVLKTARTNYLSNRLSDVETSLKTHSQRIKTLLDDSEAWEATAEVTQGELGEAYDEMQIILEQIESGQDYFGNPAGWVPMLSFEINMAIFDQEIDHALNLLYLTYWIKKNAALGEKTLETLSAVRDELKKELQKALDSYDAAVDALPVLKNIGLNLESRTRQLQQRLMVIEEHLIQKAKANLMPPWWEVALRTGAKTAGMACKLIPVGQPYLGAVGDGISMLSNFDAEQPWESVMDMGTGGIDIFSGCMTTLHTSAVTSQQNALKKVDPTSEESIRISNLKTLRNSSAALSAGLTDIRSYLSNLEAPESEILVELEKLKAESEEFISVADQIVALLHDRAHVVDDLCVAMRDVAMLPNLITQFILELDAMGNEISHLEATLDKRAIMYLDDMEQRATDRLLKYHYFMAKAYEYRLLKPYTQPLDLAGLQEKLIAIGELFDPDFISSDDFMSFKALYQEKLSLVAEEIFTNYNDNRPEVSAPVHFELSEDELQLLNQGEQVVINLMEREPGLFSSSDENIRIVDISVFEKADGSFDITTEPVGDGYGSTAYVDIKLRHSGISTIKSNGDLYKFEHYSKNTTNPIEWGARYDPVNNVVDPIKPSLASESLLQALLPDSPVADLMIYSRPSAWAEIIVSKSENDDQQNINLTRLQLELIYDYSNKNTDLDLVEFDLRVSKKDYDAQDQLAVMEAEFMPYFIVSAADVNERQDGRGSFLRFYQASNSERLEIQASENYGRWKFSYWADEDGEQISEAISESFDLQTNRTVFAHYELDQYSLPNHSPLAPLQLMPEDRASGIDLRPQLSWEAASDPDQDPVSYYVTLCADPGFDGCAPVATSGSTTLDADLAGFGGVWLSLFFLIVCLSPVWGRRRKLHIVLILILALGMISAVVSCGGGSSGPTTFQPEEPLESGTTYYWKVLASDGRGGVTPSTVWQFTTK
ncbi:MAG: hypothetical protein JRJ87_03290 [Deltaproteobacteria bacterium]|nr:hypothetical protein [Deltaproteobacteria bacterium]